MKIARPCLAALAIACGSFVSSAHAITAEFGNLGPIAVESLDVAGVRVTASSEVTAGWANPGFGLGVFGGANDGLVNGAQSITFTFLSAPAYNVNYSTSICQSTPVSGCGPRRIEAFSPDGQSYGVFEQEGSSLWLDLSRFWDNQPVQRIVITGDPAFPTVGFLIDRLRYTIFPDADGDGLDDLVDNCINVPNPLQEDGNGDNIGNICDADFTGACIVNVFDLGILRDGFFSDDPELDLNSDGAVNFVDLGILRTLFFERPDPSGYPDACNF